MSWQVIFSPEALDNLDTIENYIAEASSPETAARYIDAVVAYCASLTTFPNRGVLRDDLLAGLRITNYRARAVITFLVDELAETVAIVGVFYGGQTYEAIGHGP